MLLSINRAARTSEVLTVTVDGVTLENVGGGFNKPLLTDLLRQRRSPHRGPRRA